MQRKAYLAGLFLTLLPLSWPRADAVATIEELIEAKQYIQALGRIDAQLARQPKDAQALLLKATVLGKTGEWQKAVTLLKSLVKDHPQWPEPYNNLAVLYAEKGQLDEAQKALQAALATHPSYAAAHENLSTLYKKLASIAYNRALNGGETAAANNTADLRPIARLYTAQLAPTKVEKPAPAVKGGRADAAAATPALAVTDTPSLPTATPPAPAETHAATPVKSADTAIVTATVQAWARAWSEQDADAYIGFYAPDYTGGRPDVSRAAWETQRRDRVTTPLFIEVDVTNMQVNALAADEASVSFTQHYRSNRVNDRITKILRLRRIGERWLIVEETSR